MEKFVIKCDWASIRCYFDTKNPVFFNNKEFKIERLNQTKIFKQVYGIRDRNGVEVATFATDAYGAILPPGHGILKIANCRLYHGDCYEWVKALFPKLGLIPCNITRFDIAFDIQSFEMGYDVENFIQDFVKGTVVRNKHCKASANFAEMNKDDLNVNFTQNAQGRVFESLRIGRRTSNITTKIYNKTLEMKENKFKPWINICHKNEFGPNPGTVWRIEFSIKNFRSTFKDGKYLDDPFLPFKQMELYGMFQALYRRNFHFKWFRQGERITRMARIDLISFPEDLQFLEKEFAKPEKEKLGSKRSEKQLITKLNRHYNEFREINVKYGQDCLHAYSRMIALYGLEFWADGRTMERIPEDELDKIDFEFDESKEGYLARI